MTDNLRAALEFIADWADDCSPDDTFYGFADIAARARAALASPSPEPLDTRLDRIKRAISGYKSRDGLLGLLVEIERIAYGPLSEDS